MAEPLDRVAQPPAHRAHQSPYRYLLPLIAVMGLLTAYPLLYALYMSLYNWNWGRQFAFVGLTNYTAILTDSNFWLDVVHTAYFTAGAVSIELALGLGLALAMARLGRLARPLTTILMAPMLISGIVVTVIWKIMLDPTLGIIDWLLRGLHLPTSAFFGDVNWAMPSIIGIDTWWQTAFVFILLYAGVQSLPTDVFEAARVDGASPLQQFRHLTLPLLRPLLITVAIFRSVDALKVFALIFGTTGGGPARATESMQVLTYLTAFKQFQMSRAMTVTILFSALILIPIALALWRSDDGSA